MSAAVPHRLASLGFWTGYMTTARPYLFFVSGAGGLVGLALHPGAPAAVFAAAFLVCFLSYGLGQALTDVFQTDTDAISSPYRPLIRGEISRRQVLGVSLGGLAACAAILAAIEPATLLLAALAVAGLATYTPLKRRPWGGPPWNSGVVALLPAIGALCVAPSVAAAVDARLGWAMGSVFFSYAIFVMIGYLKDVAADRATGYRTVCVAMGRRAAALASAVCLTAALVFSVLLVQPHLGGTPSLPTAAAALLWASGLFFLGRSCLRGWNVTADEAAHPAVADSVRGFVTLHLGQAALLQLDLLPFAFLQWVLFELVLRARPARSQI
jgi:4-hydroxybenzoate polyprenyltransferase